MYSDLVMAPPLHFKLRDSDCTQLKSFSSACLGACRQQRCVDNNIITGLSWAVDSLKELQSTYANYDANDENYADQEIGRHNASCIPTQSLSIPSKMSSGEYLKPKPPSPTSKRSPFPHVPGK